MAEIKCIQTGSRGNGYAIITDNGILLLEAGVTAKKMKEAIAFRIGEVEACLISHQHGDHYEHLPRYSKAGIKCYGAGTENDIKNKKISPIELMQPVQFGAFTVIAFPLPHSVECYGYLIYHKEIGTILFATDCSEIPYYFTGVDYALIEANYSEELLQENIRTGLVNPFVENQTHQHHSIDSCVDFVVNRLNTERVHWVLLVHLSDNNSNAGEFEARIKSTAKTDFVKAVNNGDRLRIDLE